jgi:hypothetical protein
LRACAPALIAQFPELDPDKNPELQFELGKLMEMLKTAEGKEKELILGWLLPLKAKYGETFQVAPLFKGQWQHKGATDEAAEMAGEDKVITIKGPPVEDFPDNLA